MVNNPANLGVTPAEYSLLNAVHYGLTNSPCHLRSTAAGEDYCPSGSEVTEEECRDALSGCLAKGWLQVIDETALANIVSCLRYAWLRVVDQRADDEVRALLRSEPGLLSVPRATHRSWGDIDFTPVGAALYRMITAEWLGSDWEDELHVSKDYYWEEHRYCKTEEGLRHIVQEHEASGEAVRSTKLVPIGPWCVFWWDRRQSGFRLELKIGDENLRETFGSAAWPD